MYGSISSGAQRKSTAVEQQALRYDIVSDYGSGQALKGRGGDRSGSPSIAPVNYQVILHRDIFQGLQAGPPDAMPGGRGVEFAHIAVCDRILGLGDEKP